MIKWYYILNIKRSQYNKSEREIKVNIPFKNGVRVKASIYIYTTGHRVVNNSFYKFICNGEEYNNGVRSCEKDGIINLLTRIK